uniref:Family with sequence similarity 180 member A n=1 Tax=Seriola lalandi dorsalis TaxID=1841481 RepID=A0A3B4WKG6_SERLL
MLCITANWLLLPFSNLEKCTVFSPSCCCLDSQERARESRGERDDNNIVLLDKEMASMRQGRAFMSKINDDIPKSLSSMVQMVTALEGQRRRPLAQTEFESLILSMVYSAHQAWHQERKEEQEAWGGVLLQLANVTVHELPLLTPPLPSQVAH